VRIHSLPGQQLWIRSSVNPTVIRAGFWAAVGWCFLLYLPCIALAVSLINLYRKSEPYPGRWSQSTWSLEFSTVSECSLKATVAVHHRLYADPDPTCYFDADLFLIYHFDVIWSLTQTSKMKDVEFLRSNGLLTVHLSYKGS
jgi:hypothetical protein